MLTMRRPDLLETSLSGRRGLTIAEVCSFAAAVERLSDITLDCSGSNWAAESWDGLEFIRFSLCFCQVAEPVDDLMFCVGGCGDNFVSNFFETFTPRVCVEICSFPDFSVLVGVEKLAA